MERTASAASTSPLSMPAESEIGHREKPEGGEECEQPHRRGQGQKTNEIGFRKGVGHVELG